MAAGEPGRRHRVTDLAVPPKPVETFVGRPLVRYCVLTAAEHPLLNHLVGGGQQGLWNCQPERLGGLEVDEQLELGRQLNG
jgi:hypothetical protein